MKEQTTEEVRKAANVLSDYITSLQEKLDEDSREYQSLQEAYDAVYPFREEQVGI